MRRPVSLTGHHEGPISPGVRALCVTRKSRMMASGSSQGTIMSSVVNIAAAAKQLNHTLFNNTQFEGHVTADNDGLEVAVYGSWTGAKVASFAGYEVSWREAA